MWLDDAVVAGIITEDERDIVLAYKEDSEGYRQLAPEHYSIAERLYLWQEPLEDMTCH